VRGRWVFAAAALLAAGAVTRVEAQAKKPGLAIIPYGAYAVPGTLAEDDNYSFTPNSAPSIGLQLEYGASKNVAVGAGINYTFGQTLDLDYTDASTPSFTFGEGDITTMGIYGVLSFRPGGRLPSGAVTPLAIELGGGVNMLSFDKILVDTDGDGNFETAISPVDDFNSSSAMAFAGLAYNIPIGPRGSIQLFGRGTVQFGYSSQGLDDFNSTPPVSSVEGSTAFGFMIGAGLRFGR
jgi:hypothetical protein